MNIVTAPLLLLFEGVDLRRFDRPRPGPPDPAIFFLKAGTALCLIAILAGLFFVYRGIAGDVTVDIGGNTLRTGSVGVALVFIGLAFYLLIGRAVLKR